MERRWVMVFVALATACVTLLATADHRLAAMPLHHVGRQAEARAGPPVIAAAGDISCERFCAPARATARRIRRIDPRAVLTLGDNQYQEGTLAQFRRYYARHWGTFYGKTFPIPGNHEYETPGAAGYFRYFDRRLKNHRGWYSFNIGSWHLIALNSRKGARPGPRQLNWLRRDLRRERHRCQLAYVHHPRWASGTDHGSIGAMAPFWVALQRGGVDVVLSGHEHNYERFARLRPSGRSSKSGIRQFVVGTGGVGLYDFGRPRRGSQVRVKAFGVLRMALAPGHYAWKFITIGGRVRDRGSTACH